jgi:hypothetical protein
MEEPESDEEDASAEEEDEDEETPAAKADDEDEYVVFRFDPSRLSLLINFRDQAKQTDGRGLNKEGVETWGGRDACCTGSYVMGVTTIFKNCEITPASRINVAASCRDSLSRILTTASVPHNNEMWRITLTHG